MSPSRWTLWIAGVLLAIALVVLILYGGGGDGGLGGGY